MGKHGLTLFAICVLTTGWCQILGDTLQIFYNYLHGVRLLEDISYKKTEQNLACNKNKKPKQTNKQTKIFFFQFTFN